MKSSEPVISRREWLGQSFGAGATLALTPALLAALHQSDGKLIQRAIPSSGEMLPVVGQTFTTPAKTTRWAILPAVASGQYEPARWPPKGRPTGMLAPIIVQRTGTPAPRAATISNASSLYFLSSSA